MQSDLFTDKPQSLSTVETPAESIIFTQRETLAYAIRLSQWSDGSVSRRTVQIARSLLEQRLSVVDSSDKSMAQRAPRSYRIALTQADVIVASGPIGRLPAKLQSLIGARIAPAIDKILVESQKFFILYQKSIDQSDFDIKKNTAEQNRVNYFLFLIFLIFGGLFLLLSIRSNLKNYRLSKLILETEQIKSSEISLELEKTQSTVLELLNLDKAANTFISTINHELRTPLTSIIGYIDIIHREGLVDRHPDLNKYLEVLQRNADILLNLVDSILSMNQINYDGDPLSAKKVNINTVIDVSISILKPKFEKQNLTVKFSTKGTHFIKGNYGQISQVIINLLDNAIKFSRSGGRVLIIVDRTQNQAHESFVRIQVKDNGIGIPAADVDHLFTRFFRAQNAVSQQSSGTGIGLALVQEIVRSHGGQIRVSSILDEGTTFTVEIPIFLVDTHKSLEAALDVQNRESEGTS